MDPELSFEYETMGSSNQGVGMGGTPTSHTLHLALGSAGGHEFHDEWRGPLTATASDRIKELAPRTMDNKSHISDRERDEEEEEGGDSQSI